MDNKGLIMKCYCDAEKRVVEAFRPVVVDAACAGTEDAWLEVSTNVTKECQKCGQRHIETVYQSFSAGRNK